MAGSRLAIWKPLKKRRPFLVSASRIHLAPSLSKPHTHPSQTKATESHQIHQVQGSHPVTQPAVQPVGRPSATCSASLGLVSFQVQQKGGCSLRHGDSIPSNRTRRRSCPHLAHIPTRTPAGDHPTASRRRWSTAQVPAPRLTEPNRVAALHVAVGQLVDTSLADAHPRTASVASFVPGTRGILPVRRGSRVAWVGQVACSRRIGFRHRGWRLWGEG
ncbi:hypothetical protein BKA80DRAFT_282250 [Phyllosticta citrichinensis]